MVAILLKLNMLDEMHHKTFFIYWINSYDNYIDGLAQNCSSSSVLKLHWLHCLYTGVTAVLH